MSLSGNQRTRLSVGGPGRAYAPFAAKGSAITAPSGPVLLISAERRRLTIAQEVRRLIVR